MAAMHVNDVIASHRSQDTARVELSIAPMITDDIPEVVELEEVSFDATWPANAFVSEINDNKLAHYYTARINGKIVAYGGIWVVMEDSHITTIATHPDHRGRGFGEAMLCVLLEKAIEGQAAWMTLEVRVSNEAAQRLYRKYGFTVVSTRRGYYSDNQENALVMWAGDLRGSLYGKRFKRIASHTSIPSRILIG